MTDMPLTHCYSCGRELPWNRIDIGDRAYCGAECLPVNTVAPLPDPRIAALEADLAEALELLKEHLTDTQESGVYSRLVKTPYWMTPICRRTARLLAKHGRFKITRDDDWTEGFWPEK